MGQIVLRDDIGMYLKGLPGSLILEHTESYFTALRDYGLRILCKLLQKRNAFLVYNTERPQSQVTTECLCMDWSW